MTVPKQLNELGYDLEEIAYFVSPSYDTAFVGVSVDGRVIYDFELMAEYLMKEEDMDYEEAVDFIHYNTIRSLPYIENSPIIIQSCKYDLSSAEQNY